VDVLENVLKPRRVRFDELVDFRNERRALSVIK
jgi:hypothetical protein